jgi:enoyl-CoA hydratase/carnithine racemase
MGVREERHGDVAEIVLDWPEVRNALGPAEGAELRVALTRAACDPKVGAIVLSANGSAFCSGGKLPEIVELARGGPEAVRTAVYGEFQGVFRALQSSPVPVIAAVDGPAIGFGCDLALAANISFIGCAGWLAQGWMRAGLIPATGGTLYAMRRGGAAPPLPQRPA